MEPDGAWSLEPGGAGDGHHPHWAVIGPDGKPFSASGTAPSQPQPLPSYPQSSASASALTTLATPYSCHLLSHQARSTEQRGRGHRRHAVRLRQQLVSYVGGPNPDPNPNPKPNPALLGGAAHRPHDLRYAAKLWPYSRP